MSRIEKTLQWTARVLSVGLIGLFLMLLIGEGVRNPFGLTERELALFAAMWVMLGGLAAAWSQPRVGGAVALLGYLGFVSVSGGVPGGEFFPLYPLTAVLFIVAGTLKTRRVDDEKA